jgi:Spy/CpxP family protein refolding chaperone
MRKKQLICGLSVALVILMATSLVMAQQPQGGQRGQRGQGGQRGQSMRGNFDPAQMQQRMLQGMQEQMGMTDAEMNAIKPLMTKVMGLRRDLQAGRMRGMMSMMRGRGGDRGSRGQQDTTSLTGLAKIQNELRTLVENDDTKAAQIKAKLTEYRKAREKIQQNLAKTQSQLIGYLTPKQEAILLMSGQVD